MESSENFEIAEREEPNNNGDPREEQSQVVIDVPATIAVERWKPQQDTVEELNRPRPESRPLAGAAIVKHGSNTKYFPKRLQDRYEELVNDPDYVSLQEEIAAIRIIRDELIQRWSTLDSQKRRGDMVKKLTKITREAAESPVSWNNLSDFQEMSINQEIPPLVMRGVERIIGAAQELVGEIAKLLEDAQNERRQDEILADAGQYIELLRKLKETEVKRMVAANQVLTITESYMLITSIAAMVEKYVQDKDEAAKFVREIHGLLNRR